MSDVATKREGDTPETKESQLNAKRAKCDDTDGQGDQSDGESARKSDILSGFVTSQILNDSAREKKIFVHGKVRELSAANLALFSLSRFGCFEWASPAQRIAMFSDGGHFHNHVAGQPGGCRHHGENPHQGGEPGRDLQELQAGAGHEERHLHHLQAAGAGSPER